MQDTSSPVLVSKSGPVITLVLNRPSKLNALNDDLTARLGAALREAGSDDEVRVVVIRGAGPGFMAGGDLEEFTSHPGRAAEMAGRFQEAISVLVALRKPVIASLHGAVAGGGLALAMACDLAVAAENVRLVFAYPKLGVNCDGGLSYRLPRLVGMRRALEIALLDEPIGAADALRLGLVNLAVPIEMLEAETARVAVRLAKLDPMAASAIKTLFAESWERSFADQLGAELESFACCADRPEFLQRVAAIRTRAG